MTDTTRGAPQRRRNVTLSDEHMDTARRLGGGNASAGIRRALEALHWIENPGAPAPAGYRGARPAPAEAR